MQKIIWVDLDDVLAELLDHCLEYHNYQINWKSISREKVLDYYISRMKNYKIESKIVIDWFRKATLDDIWKYKIQPVKWAIEWLKKLKEKWYKLKIVTARNEEIIWEYTKNWIEKYYPNIFEEIIFANHFSKNHKSKADICKEHGIEIMIEDNPDYAQELAQNWVKTFLLEKPWNKGKCINNKNIICVKSWREIVEKF